MHMLTETRQPVTTDVGVAIERASAPSVEYAARNLNRKEMVWRQNIFALSTDLAQASVILANRATEIVSFASALPNDCSREETTARISAFVESLYPLSCSLRSRRSFHSGLGEMITNCVSGSCFLWILTLTVTGLLGLAALLIAK
jgi:hypothetical protein